jgi:tetratricopeptide (TPR) repeat protein
VPPVFSRKRRKPVLIISKLIRRCFSLLIVLSLVIGISASYASTTLDDIFLNKYPLESSDLENIYQYKLDRGIVNLSSASFFLLRGSDRLLTEGKVAKAVEYAEYALRLSPAYPPVYFQLGKVYWTQNRLRLHSIVTGWFKSLRAVVRNYSFAVYVLTNQLLLLFIAFLLLIAVFTLISVYKYSKLFIHQLTHLLPFGLPWHLYLFWGIFILVVPVFFHWSIFLIFFFWLILLFVFHAKREQLLIIIFAFFFLASPFFIQLVSNLIVTSSSDRYYSLFQANEDNWDRETELQLSKWLQNNPTDIETLFALGLIKKREGSYRAAQDYYEQIISIDPGHYRSICNLGNVLIARKKPDLAIANYDRCISLDPESVRGYYNLSRAQLLEFMFKESNKSFKKAAELNAEEIDYFIKIYSENINRMVIDETIPLQIFWENTFQPSKEKVRTSEYLWNAFFRGLPYQYWYSVFFVFFFFVCLIYVDRYRSDLSIGCDYCGRAACKKCKTFVPEFNLCKQCAGIFKGNRNISISVKNKEKHVIGIERFHTSHIIIGKILSFLLPGAGHLFLDKPVKGALILFSFFFISLKIIFKEGIIDNSWQMVNVSSYGGMFILAFVLCTLYGYSIWDYTRVSGKLSQFLSLIRVTRKELQIQKNA